MVFISNGRSTNVTSNHNVYSTAGHYKGLWKHFVHSIRIQSGELLFPTIEVIFERRRFKWKNVVKQYENKIEIFRRSKEDSPIS